MIAITKRRIGSEGWDESIDLSMVDNAGNPRATMTTANCYLVHDTGDYKIPLVYGNAIKNGEVNTVAFNPGGTTNSAYCANFTNHADTAITAPWITKPSSGNGINKGMGYTTATVAALAWQDSPGLIDDVYIDGDYLHFHVGSFVGGNALIGVKDSINNTFIWSWHIWATENDLSDTTVISTGSHDYIITSVNLGWVPTNSDGKQGYCPYYQWGRKDPFIPSTGSSNTDHVVYDINNNTITALSYIYDKTRTIGDTIKTPTCHFASALNYDVCSITHYYNMWDAQNTSTGNNVSTVTKKTIYDPCPPGFCVPTSNLYFYFASNNTGYNFTWDNTNKGYLIIKDLINLWFPASGIRPKDSISLSSVGTSGYYYTSIPYNNAYANFLLITTNSRFISYTYRAIESSIRPVVEE